MTNKHEWEIMSRRRMVSLLGLAAALGFAVPGKEAEAQTPSTAAPSTAAPTTESKPLTHGAARRQERRGGRVERRYERRGGTPASKQPAQAPAAEAPAAQAPATQPPPAQK